MHFRVFSHHLIVFSGPLPNFWGTKTAFLPVRHMGSDDRKNWNQIKGNFKELGRFFCVGEVGKMMSRSAKWWVFWFKLKRLIWVSPRVFSPFGQKKTCRIPEKYANYFSKVLVHNVCFGSSHFPLFACNFLVFLCFSLFVLVSFCFAGLVMCRGTCRNCRWIFLCSSQSK